MDEHIFRQLDMLDQEARTERPGLPVPRPSNVYEDDAPSNADPFFDQNYNDRQAPYMDQPIVLDPFGEQLLRQPYQSSRHGQAALGRARLSLPPTSTQATWTTTQPHQTPPQPYTRRAGSPRMDLSGFAFEPTAFGAVSSSPFTQQMPSSPTFDANQRHLAPRPPGRPIQQCFPSDVSCNEQMHLRQPSWHTTNEVEEGSQTGLPIRQGATQNSIQISRINRDPPVIQGITLVSIRALPDRFRPIFAYPLFNAVQSKCFDTIYKNNDNFVLTAPTGSGKTAVLELAICRLINGFADGSFKVVYQAPTKSLCSERHRDWQTKFGPLGLQCAELTGDTEGAQLRNVQHATIIITTPEKWDSMTRKWKDHQKLMQMVKLFLIDEVHLLKEDRGATLEAVVSRMKSVGSDVRFVALSATVPNSQDIATWLGKDAMNPHVPASSERFGEQFRPVRLQKHVCGYQNQSNAFAFDKVLSGKLPEVIAKWSQRKPIMIFCFTRSACSETAKTLVKWWESKDPRERYWSPPRKRIVVGDKNLLDAISAGVAFHHAGLTMDDRMAVERGYLEGDINVICCTSTLAVGVNLPCHLVIIKNTVSYQNPAAGGCKEYSDLEVMQMLGRAGRPQFDNNAVAVIMTRLQRVSYYEKMITGQEVLESCLHRNLIDHLNSEIGLGTITSVSSAKKWLTGTFLYVRLKENPEHYKLEGDAAGLNLDERLQDICIKGLDLLAEHKLVSATPSLRCTEFGDAMARYYVQFETMKAFLALPRQAKVSEILSTISLAAEFKELRFRAGEKAIYKMLNKNTSVKFPIPVNLELSAHKVSLVMQSVLGDIELPTEDSKQRFDFTAAKAIIFQHSPRLVRCIIDCSLHLEDAVTTRNALMLARSLGARVWDDSPLHMKQLEGVGSVAVRKLVGAGIKSIEDLELADADRIEGTLSRNPPYGTHLQEKAKAFPKLRVSIKMIGEPTIRYGDSVTVKLHADIGFLNEKLPESFQRRTVYACFLAETSNGTMLDFARISAKKLKKSQEVLFSADLTSPTEAIHAYVMCDDIAGTMQHARLKPNIPSSAFPLPKVADTVSVQTQHEMANAISFRGESLTAAVEVEDTLSDEFGDDCINDADLARAEVGGFVDIDELDLTRATTEQPKPKNQNNSSRRHSNKNWEPRQLDNGKWACNHLCKDKTACKHLCCREGLDKKPKPPKAKEAKPEAPPALNSTQTQLNMPVLKKQVQKTREATSSSKITQADRRVADEPKDVRELNRLQSGIKTKTPNIPTLMHSHAKKMDTVSSTKRERAHSMFVQSSLSLTDQPFANDEGGDSWISNELPDTADLIGVHRTSYADSPLDQGPSDDAECEMLDTASGVQDDSAAHRSYSTDDGDALVCLCSANRAPNDTEDPEDPELLDDGLDESFGSTAEALVDQLSPDDIVFTADSHNVNLGGGPPLHRQEQQSSAQSRAHKRELPDDRSELRQSQTSNKCPRNNASNTNANTGDGTEGQRAGVLSEERCDTTGGTAFTPTPAVEQRPKQRDLLEELFYEQFGSDMFNLIG